MKKLALIGLVLKALARSLGENDATRVNPGRAGRLSSMKHGNLIFAIRQKRKSRQIRQERFQGACLRR
ncbi:MAG: hypothetical protein WA153_11770, partial [Candidatus Acidiferrales bacterium]